MTSHAELARRIPGAMNLAEALIEVQSKHCPNPQCPSARLRSRPEFRAELEACPRCGTELEDGPGIDEPDAFVELCEVATFTYVHEAELAAAHLDAAGIPSTITNRNTLGMYSLLSVAIGGVKLLVPVEDLEAAREVLTDDFRNVEIDGVGPYRGGLTRDETACSRCGSHDIEPPRSTPLVLSIVCVLVPILLPLLFRVPKATCRSCGARWRAAVP